jgi:hypothetical protein
LYTPTVGTVCIVKTPEPICTKGGGPEVQYGQWVSVRDRPCGGEYKWHTRALTTGHIPTFNSSDALMSMISSEMTISTAYLAGQLFHVKYVIIFGLPVL